MTGSNVYFDLELSRETTGNNVTELVKVDGGLDFNVPALIRVCNQMTPTL